MDSFLLMGQSNMVGCGNLDDVKKIDNERCFVFRNSNWSKMEEPIFNEPNSGISLAASFADCFTKYFNKSVGLIPCAVGGTKLEQHMPGEKIYLETIQKAIEAQVNSKIIGILWYQGESNEGLKECEYYSQLLEMLISSWRNEFCEEFPVLLVQLTAYGSYIKKDATVEDKCNYNDDGPECVWAKLREQQLIASQQIKDVYMVTTIDTSEFSQIHPTGKDIVAERLAIAANNIISNKREEYSGPIFKDMCIEGSRAIISFSHAECLCDDESLDYLVICGKDEIYYPAKYEIIDNKLVVYSNEVETPYGVKYAFCNWATGGLYNEKGFPASSFRVFAIK